MSNDMRNHAQIPTYWDNCALIETKEDPEPHGFPARLSLSDHPSLSTNFFLEPIEGPKHALDRYIEYIMATARKAGRGNYS